MGKLRLNAFIEPLLEWEKQQETAHKSDYESIETIRSINLKRIDKLQLDAAKCDKPSDRESIILEIERLKEETPEEKYPPRLWTGDVTPERLQSLMAEHGEKMSLLSDEGGIFEIMAGLYSDGAANLDVFLKGHSGSAVRVDRGKRTVYMDNPALTFGLAVQPQIIQEFGIGKKRRFRGNGALARFLYCLPKSNVGKRDVTRRHIIPDSVKVAYRHGIQHLLGIECEETQILTLDEESLRAWLTFCQYIESNQGEGGDFEAIQDWTGKLPGAALRIASLFHLAETGGSTLILSKKSMEPALDLCELLIVHCMTAFCTMGNDQTAQDAIQVYNWLIRENKQRVKRRDIHRALHGRFTKADRLDSALNELVQRNILSPPEHEKTGRRPSIWHSVNPQILGENNHGMA